MSDLRVYFAAADTGGCGFYRMREPARAARLIGVHTRVELDVPIDGEQRMNKQTADVHDVMVDADVLVLQRPLLRTFCDIIPIAQAKGIAVVVELDDDFECINPRNVAWSSAQPELSPNANWKWLKKACFLADWVTVSTPALERYAPHGRVSVLRNRVPAYYLDVPKPERIDDAIRVGWSGTLQTHPDDLQVTNGMVWQAVEQTGSQFCVIGDGEGIMNALRIPEGSLVGATGWVPLKDYVTYVALLLDIGIVPLENSRFNNAKSSIKGLEMAALGVPFVASPLPEYRRIALNDLGIIASKPRDWYKAVRKLAVSHGLREELAGAGRETIRKHHLYEDAGEEWTQAWLSALKHRRMQLVRT